MRLLIFIFIEFWLLPWQILAILVHSFKVMRRTNPAKISGTANEVLNARLIMHTAGTRPDQPTARLSPHLPAHGTVIAWLIGIFGLASRWSGCRSTCWQRRRGRCTASCLVVPSLSASGRASSMTSWEW